MLWETGMVGVLCCARLRCIRHWNYNKLLISALLYKEKYNHRQLISVVIGIPAVVLMNIKI